MSKYPLKDYPIKEVLKERWQLVFSDDEDTSDSCHNYFNPETGMFQIETVDTYLDVCEGLNAEILEHICKLHNESLEGKTTKPMQFVCTLTPVDAWGKL